MTFLFQVCVSGLRYVKIKHNSDCPAFPPGLEEGSNETSVGVI